MKDRKREAFDDGVRQLRRTSKQSWVGLTKSINLPASDTFSIKLPLGEEAPPSRAAHGASLRYLKKQSDDSGLVTSHANPWILEAVHIIIFISAPIPPYFKFTHGLLSLHQSGVKRSRGEYLLSGASLLRLKLVHYISERLSNIFSASQPDFTSKSNAPHPRFTEINLLCS